MRLAIVLAPALLLLVAGSAAAQGIPSVALVAEIGPAIPLGAFADDGAQLGWATGASATLRLSRPFGVYAAVERSSFPVESAVAGAAARWTDTGFGAGVRFWMPAPEDAWLQPWVQLGLGWHNADPPIGWPASATADTDGLLALEGGGGADMAFAGQRILLRPAIRYRRFAFDLTSPDVPTSRTTVSWLTLALGAGVVLGPRTPGEVAR